MFIIKCPYCGPRDQIEFSYGGEAHRKRPEHAQLLPDEEWAEFLFMRENEKGLIAERWNHRAGCRHWFNMLRNSATDQILAVYAAGSQPPEVETAALPTPCGEATIGSGNDAAKIEREQIMNDECTTA